MCLMFALWGQIDWKSLFWKIWVEFKCFWKTFRLILMHFFIIKQCALRSICIKMLYFSKFWFFQTFDRSNLFFDQSKLQLKFLVWVCLTQLMFNWFLIDRNWKIFSFYVFEQKFFSCIICVQDSHTLHCFCIHLAVL